MSNSLRRLLAQDDTIIFVGSGISRWAGLPSWEDLIGELAEYLERNDIDSTLVRQEAGGGDLLQAASYGFLKLTLPQIANFMRQACKTGVAVPGQIHRAIMKLGPSCFITTNYDDLLEQAYREHRSELRQPRIVLNTQLLEQAEIIHAQAREFIFKPHGDAGTVESIVLTREQYRMLMPDGKFSATLNTFKTLLQSRPVLFVGFGLRDPDFLYMREILANIYRGGMRDHYAIVADPLRDQEDYWRTHYGIHLIGYATANGGRDHTELLTLLKSLESGGLEPPTPSDLDVADPATILALARYAASCLMPIDGDCFVIRVSSRSENAAHLSRQTPYDYWPVKRLLLEGPNRLILVGEPGAGKSFAIQDVVNGIAAALQDACLRGELNKTMRVPIMIDLKQYEGDLAGQVSAKFAETLQWDRLHAAFPIMLYIDGYNELPRDFREDGTFDGQLDQLLETYPQMGVVIGSRNSDGLEWLQLPVFALSEISVDEIERRQDANGISVPEAHRDDITRVLQRPFYYRLLNSAVMSLEQVRTPGDLYAQFINNIRARFEETFDCDLDLVAVLQRQAYHCLEQGSEAFAIKDLTAAVSTLIRHLKPTETDDIANWLASAEFIIPLKGHRGAFVHQSVTEYLAARELKQRLEHNADSAAALLNLRRWDNAIFLAIGMLDETLADRLLTEIASRDISFALKAARFVQHGAEAQVGKLLNIISRMPNDVFDFEAQSAFRKLPFAPAHEAMLKSILGCLPALRGATYVELTKVLGARFKQELIDSLFSEEDYNTLQAIGEALSLVVEQADLHALVEKLVAQDIESLEDDRGTTHKRVGALAAALIHFPVAAVRTEILARLSDFNRDQRRIAAALLCDIYENCGSVEGLALLIEIARAQLPYTLFALYINVRYEPELRANFLDMLDDELFDTILHYVDQGDEWSVELLKACGDADRTRPVTAAAAPLAGAV